MADRLDPEQGASHRVKVSAPLLEVRFQPDEVIGPVALGAVAPSRVPATA